MVGGDGPQGALTGGLRGPLDFHAVLMRQHGQGMEAADDLEDYLGHPALPFEVGSEVAVGLSNRPPEDGGCSSDHPVRLEAGYEVGCGYSDQSHMGHQRQTSPSQARPLRASEAMRLRSSLSFPRDCFRLSLRVEGLKGDEGDRRLAANQFLTLGVLVMGLPYSLTGRGDWRVPPIVQPNCPPPYIVDLHGLSGDPFVAR